MPVVDEIVDRVRREDEAIQAIVDRFVSLERHAQQRCIARLVAVIEDEKHASVSLPKRRRAQNKPDDETAEEVAQRVQTFLVGNDDDTPLRIVESLANESAGLTSAQIAERIGQTGQEHARLLRWLARVRILAERDGRWFKLPFVDREPRHRTHTLRQVIIDVLTGDDRWAKTSRIHELVHAVRPGTTPASVQVEVSRMLRDGVLMSRGRRDGEGRGAYYAVTTHAREAATTEAPVSK